MSWRTAGAEMARGREMADQRRRVLAAGRSLAGECHCEFDPRYDEDDGGPGESWHFHRTCASCGTEWAGLHCRHDGIQNRCPGCGVLPEVVREGS